jgi:hypothetical protein
MIPCQVTRAPRRSLEERIIAELVQLKMGGYKVESDLVGLLAVSIVFSAIAIIEGLMVSPIFYSMAGVILAMRGYFIMSDRLSQKMSGELPQQQKE